MSSPHNSTKQPECDMDPITAEEIKGTAPSEETQSARQPERVNACMKPPSSVTQRTLNSSVAELMAPKKSKSSLVQPRKSPLNSIKHIWDPRDGLGVYIDKPEAQPPGAVVEYDDEFVLIRDLYPKSTVHLLLIPRDPVLSRQHPLKALSMNPAFLASVRARLPHIIQLAADELRRQYGRYSAQDAPYQTALEELMSRPDPPPAAERAALLPQGRDWLREVECGVHTHPSMNHLHIHVRSRENHSPCLKHKKHYLSFNSSFFVKIDEFPLEDGSERFHPGPWPDWDMLCWRCGRNFQNKFKRLKEHLEEEFEAWKKE